jgi:uncharacterized protein (DUF2236 family)
MSFSLTEDHAAWVTRSDSEALLAAVAQHEAHPQAGIFGPESVTWKINRESALFLGAGRAALLQLAHPWVAAALAQHSSLLSRPIARFHNTFRIVFTMIFGSLDQALAAARHLYALHTRIQGELPEQAAAYPQGSHYRANEIGALRWVYATLVESAVLAHDCVLPPLTASEREAYYAESKIMASLFGIPPSALPEDWSAFKAYIDQTVESGALGVSQTALPMADNLLSGAGSWIHPPHWYRALTASWLPPRFREEFALEFGPRELKSADRAKHRLPGLYRRLPTPIRFIGPWHEAQARLKGRRIGPLARMSNRFWVGQSRLPFGEIGE